MNAPPAKVKSKLSMPPSAGWCRRMLSALSTLGLNSIAIL